MSKYGWNVILTGILVAGFVAALIFKQYPLAVALVGIIVALWRDPGTSSPAFAASLALALASCSPASQDFCAGVHVSSGTTAPAASSIAPFAGHTVDYLSLKPQASVSCTSSYGCLYVSSGDNLMYDVDAAGLTLKSHAAKSIRTSASCSGLSSPANGDVCYDTGSNVFKFYSGGWSTGPVDDSLVVHKAGSETISGTKTLAGGLLASGSTANNFSGSTGDFTASTGALGWAGAAAKAASLVASGAAITITADAASVWKTLTSTLRIDAATTLNLGTTDATAVVLGRSGQNMTLAGQLAADLNANSHKITSVTTPTSSGDAANKSYVDLAAPEIFFTRTCTLTSAAAATPVTCLADAVVTGAKVVYLMGWHAKVNGATNWATTANCYIADSSGAGGTGIIYVTMAVAALAGNSYVSDHSANITQGDAYALNSGGTAAKGLVIECNANGTGSDLVVTVFGSVK